MLHPNSHKGVNRVLNNSRFVARRSLSNSHLNIYKYMNYFLQYSSSAAIQGESISATNRMDLHLANAIPGQITLMPHNPMLFCRHEVQIT